MGTPFLGEIKIFAFNFPPRGWALCNGQLLAINQNQALFSLLGTTYGGNGQTTFALPNLQGRAPAHFGSSITLGQSAGEENHTLTISEMPTHTHVPNGNSGTVNVGSAANATWGANAADPYSNAAPDVTMSPTAINPTGGSQPHSNIQPYLVLNFCIALQGVFPSRN